MSMIRYAFVNGKSTEPFKGLKGFCPGCSKPVIAKCGTMNAHHWAHEQRFDCDPWWEPMTQWHINWQNHFPVEWREVIFRDEETKEFHRADVHTPHGLTIEFQHSFLSVEELTSRNEFYKKIIWIVDASCFKDRFQFTKEIPNPNSTSLLKYDFMVDHEGLANFGYFYLKKDRATFGPAMRAYSFEDEELSEVMEEFDKSEKLYWLFKWQHKRRAWLASTSPIFLDFGDEYIYWIRKRKQIDTHLLYIQKFTKANFLKKYSMQLDID